MTTYLGFPIQRIS